MSATVRENIIFFHEYEETFYNLVIEGKLYMICRDGRLIHWQDVLSGKTWRCYPMAI
jgi:hypothetical protein